VAWEETAGQPIRFGVRRHRQKLRGPADVCFAPGAGTDRVVGPPQFSPSKRAAPYSMNPAATKAAYKPSTTNVHGTPQPALAPSVESAWIVHIVPPRHDGGVRLRLPPAPATIPEGYLNR